MNKKMIIIIFLILIIICVGIFIYFKFLKTDNNQSINSNNQDIIKNSNANLTNSTNETTRNSNLDEDFSMTIENVYTVTGSGTVVTGKVKSGTVYINDSVQIVNSDNQVKSATVTGIEMYREIHSSATAGDSAGLILNGIEKDEVKIGDVLTKANP